MRRVSNWRPRLVAEVERWRHREFAWGDADCVAFAAACVEAMTGRDLLEPFFGQWNDPSTALARMAQGGWESLGAAVAHLLPVKPPSRARMGDLAIVSAPPGANAFPDALGVVNGATILVRSPLGIGPVPLVLATQAFEV